MSNFCVFLKMEPYLQQWYIHKCGGQNPVQLSRGCSESDILQCYLTKLPEGESPQLKPKDGEIAIEIPFFKTKDPRTYNYLRPHAKQALYNCIKNQFDVELWLDLSKLENLLSSQKQGLIYAWMETHGIECTETNWCTIDKSFYRKRKANFVRQNYEKKK